MRVLVADLVSPSYFTATAAVELGFFKEEGVEAEIVPLEDAHRKSLQDPDIDFVAGSAYGPLREYPNFKGAKLLCALSQHTYWFLVLRSDLNAKRGDVSAVKGLRIGASDSPGLGLRCLLAEAGVDVERDKVAIQDIRFPSDRSVGRSRVGVEGIKRGIVDGFWGNAMRAEMAVREGVGTVLLDVRRGDGPPNARHYTFPVLYTTDELIEKNPKAAAGAVRAIVKAQKALAADPSLATPIGRRLFPPEEAEIIAELIKRDAPFYDASISEEAFVQTCRFAEKVGLMSAPVAYEQAVAARFAHLWKGK
jgi:ABC-type nitrate/sulfonate/bicarbonate transport system substrate-binding protein